MDQDFLFKIVVTGAMAAMMFVVIMLLVIVWSN